MPPTTFIVSIEADLKTRLERLATRTGRSPSSLAAEAIGQYLEMKNWQATGISQAIASLDRGERVSHETVREWVASWGTSRERPAPRG